MKEWIKSFKSNFKSFSNEVQIAFDKSFLSNSIQAKEEEEGLSYQPLTPKILESNSKVSIYLEAMKVGIQNNDIRNIALTGVYGSGKSSLIKTFTTLYKSEYKFLNISLASFQSGEGQDEVGKQVELSIIQQIIYHVSFDKIPDSRFKRINNIDGWNMFRSLLSFFLFIISAVIIYKYDYLDNLNPKAWTWKIIDLDFAAIFVFSLFFTAGCIIGRRLVRFFNNSRVSKISLKGELDFDKIDKSILNEYLDELLYFFERNHYDMVVIEDLDRFENSLTIFTKLREINLLINESEQRKNKKKIVFLYAIKDEVFAKQDERTKFFDFIIPVIPIINKSNSSGKLRDKLSALKKDDRPTERFIEDIALYVDDMRLLNNICNEYRIYREILSPKLKPDRLLGIIVYKNLRPYDFNLLNSGKGILHEAVSARKKAITSHVSRTDVKIKELEERITSIENERQTSLRELRLVYLHELDNSINNFYAILMNGRDLKAKDLVDDENFKNLKEAKTINYKYIGSNNYISTSSISNIFLDLEKRVDSNISYDEREKRLLGKSDGSINSILKEIQNLKIEKTNISSWSLSKLFTTENFENSLNEDIKKDMLLLFLVKNGHIKEDYFDYVSYFQEGSITQRDHDFLQSVQSKLTTDKDQPLDKVTKVVTKIGLEHFNDKYILNYDLIDRIFQDSRFSLQRNTLIAYFIEMRDVAIEFILGYQFVGKNFKWLIKSICERDKYFWLYIEDSTKYLAQQRLELLLIILKHAEPKDIKGLANNSNLVLFVNELLDPIGFLGQVEDPNKVNDVISILGLKFKNLEGNYALNDGVFEYVVANSHYKINSININIILLNQNDSITKEELDTQNYTTLSENGSKELRKYISKNFNEYVSKVLLKKKILNESQEAMALIINNPDVKSDIKSNFLELSSKEITDLSVIEEIEDMATLIKKNLISINWENIFTYFERTKTKELDQVLVDFLNDDSVFPKLPSFDDKPNQVLKDDFRNLQVAIFHCNDLTNETYHHIIQTSENEWDNLQLTKIDQEKVQILIELNKLVLSIENYETLEDEFADLHILFLKTNYPAFLNSYQNYHVTVDDQTKLLGFKDLNLNLKLKHILLFDENILISNKELGVQAAEILASSQLSNLNFSLISGLFSCSNSNETRIKLFNNNKLNLSRQQAEALLAKMSYPYSRFLLSRKRTKIQANNYNKEFAKRLEDLDVISSTKLTNDKIIVIARY